MAAGRKDVSDLLGTSSAPRGSNGGSDLSHGGLSVAVERVAANPWNTRKLDTPAARKSITELGQSILATGQVQASAVVTADAFRAIFPADQYPKQNEAIGSAEWVQVTGGRRRAAVIATDGLTTLDIRENNAFASDRTRFLTATAVENIDRADLDAVEESDAVEHTYAEIKADIDATIAAGDVPEIKDATLLTGQAFGKSKGWVSKRRNIASLTPAVKKLIGGTPGLSIHAAEGLHQIKDADEQLAEAKRRIESKYQPARKADKGPDSAGDGRTGTDEGDGQDEDSGAGSGSLLDRIKSGEANLTPKINVGPDALATALLAEWSLEDRNRLIQLLEAHEYDEEFKADHPDAGE